MAINDLPPNQSSPPLCTQNSPSSSPSPSPSPIPNLTRYQFAFPLFLEHLFAPLDNTLITICQRRTSGFVHFFSMTFTFFTSIEFCLVAPPSLHALGYDAAAGLATSVLIVLGIISQVPKKFIFRPRPWMVGRALPIRRDKTSSFPSRAVVCAVVFSWLTISALKLEGALHPQQLSISSLWLGIVGVAMLAAFARVNVGAHYPSDTLLGFVLGCFVVWVGSLVEQRWQTLGCGVDQREDTVEYAVVQSWQSLMQLSSPSVQRLVRMTAVAYAMTLISIQGFWVKCSYVYGLLLSSATFRAAFLCTGGGDRVRRVVQHGSIRQHVEAVGFFVGLLVFGMLTRGKKGPFRVVAFTIIYVGALLGILYWRIRPEVGERL